MIGVDWHTVSLVEGRFALNLSTVNLSTVVWLDSGILRDDVAPSYARFGIFVGNARSLEIEGNRITQIPAFNTFYPRADAIRVVGYLGPKAIVRGNYARGARFAEPGPGAKEPETLQAFKQPGQRGEVNVSRGLVTFCRCRTS